MAFKDKEKERAWRKAYKAANKEMYKEIYKRYYENHKEERKAYAKEYCARPEVIARRAEYYLENREELLKKNKINRMLKGYPTQVNSINHRTVSRKYQRRKKEGIVIDRNENGFFWKAGKLWNGYFKYKKEAIKDAEEAFCL